MTLDPDFVARANALYRAGNSIENVGYELGCGKARIIGALDQAGTPRRTIGESIRASTPLRGPCRYANLKRDT